MGDTGEQMTSGVGSELSRMDRQSMRDDEDHWLQGILVTEEGRGSGH